MKTLSLLRLKDREAVLSLLKAFQNEEDEPNNSEPSAVADGDHCHKENEDTELSCRRCSLLFDNMDSTRIHFSSKWHLYNVHLDAKHMATISEDEFNKLTSLEDDFGAVNLNEELETQVVATALTKETQSLDKTYFKQLFWLQDKMEYIGVLKQLFINRKTSRSEHKSTVISSIRDLCQYKVLKTAIILLSGGHFAASIFHDDKAIIHKTFHKYIVRAGQGGVQSAHDNQGGNAKSAGANLRRHNEQHLHQKIIDLMASWREELSDCHLVLLRLPHRAQGLLFDDIFSKTDERVKVVPLTVQRPTHEETQRIVAMVMNVYQASSNDIRLETVLRSRPREQHGKAMKNKITRELSLLSNSSFGSDTSSSSSSDENGVTDIPKDFTAQEQPSKLSTKEDVTLDTITTCLAFNDHKGVIACLLTYFDVHLEELAAMLKESYLEERMTQSMRVEVYSVVKTAVGNNIEIAPKKARKKKKKATRVDSPKVEGPVCYNVDCGKSISDLVRQRKTFNYLEFHFCSPACLRVHRFSQKK